MVEDSIISSEFEVVDLLKSQKCLMREIWDNKEDEVWDKPDFS